MLLESRRKDELKERILSSWGHLSNDLSANYMKEVVGDKTKLICLAHLSEECNTHEIALTTYKNILNDSSKDYINNIELLVLNQKEMVVYD